MRGCFQSETDRDDSNYQCYSSNPDESNKQCTDWRMKRNIKIFWTNNDVPKGRFQSRKKKKACRRDKYLKLSFSHKVGTEQGAGQQA